MTPHLNCLKKIQMRGHNIWFYAELTKIIPNHHQILLSSALEKSYPYLMNEGFSFSIKKKKKKKKQAVITFFFFSNLWKAFLVVMIKSSCGGQTTVISLTVKQISDSKRSDKISVPATRV